MAEFDDNPTGPQQADPRFGPPTSANPLWRAVVVAGGLFCLSCLLWITAGFADQQAPGNRWLNQNGLLLVGGTGVASVLSALSAMWTDSVQTRRMLDSQDRSPDHSDTRRTGNDHH
jgi:hypothetical protein